MSTETLVDPLPDPDAGEAESHAAPEVTLQFKVPPPEFEIFRVCDAGFAPPAVAVKLNEPGLAEMLGEAGAPQPGNLTEPIRETQVEADVVAVYSVVYQKVQSSEGSTDIEL
jgi:hypothetical protein